MEIIYGLIGLLAGVALVYKLINRIDSLEKKVAWASDRSPQAQYLRHLEDQENGWESTPELTVVTKHLLNLNAAQNLVLRALLLENPVVMLQLREFCERYPVNTEEERTFVKELKELLVPDEE